MAMVEYQSSYSIVLSDITEDLAETRRNRSNVAEQNADCFGAGGNVWPVWPCQDSASGSVSAITKAAVVDPTFYSSQLLKPVVCVENDVISGTEGSDKPMHNIVIQYSPSPQTVRLPNKNYDIANFTSEVNNSRVKIESAPVIPVRCSKFSAELHKEKFGSGNRGRCIKYGTDWFTPKEFEAFCGKASNKDWKRSIWFGDSRLQHLINQGLLTPHAACCVCGICCDDETVTGPIRYYTPRKRRKNEEKKNKNLTEADADHISQTCSNSQSVTWQTISDDVIDSNYRHLPDPEVNESFRDADINKVLKKLNNIGQTLMRVSNKLNQCVEEVRIIKANALSRNTKSS